MSKTRNNKYFSFYKSEVGVRGFVSGVIKKNIIEDGQTNFLAQSTLFN